MGPRAKCLRLFAFCDEFWCAMAAAFFRVAAQLEFLRELCEAFSAPFAVKASYFLFGAPKIRTAKFAEKFKLSPYLLLKLNDSFAGFLYTYRFWIRLHFVE